VRYAPVRLATADVGDPLPEYGRIDQRISPKHVADPRVCSEERPHGAMGDESYFGGDKGSEAMIHDLKMKALQVWNVTWNMERQDLPLSTGKHLVAEREPFEDRAALRGPVLIADDILIRLQGSHSYRQAEDRVPLVIREIDNALQLANERVQVVGRCGEHSPGSGFTREHT